MAKMARAAALALALVVLALAANRFSKPKTVIHVVTLYYKDGTSEEQKRAVQDAIEKMAGEVPGIRNIWLKSLKVQGSYHERQADGGYRTRPFTDTFVVEFEDERAFRNFDEHPAYRAFEKVYGPVHARSITQDVTNP
jgi:hypothetical protein